VDVKVPANMLMASLHMVLMPLESEEAAIVAAD
jgi:hypothetical protein